jgi:hypothetical protein
VALLGPELCRAAFIRPGLGEPSRPASFNVYPPGPVVGDSASLGWVRLLLLLAITITRAFVTAPPLEVEE